MNYRNDNTKPLALTYEIDIQKRNFASQTRLKSHSGNRRKSTTTVDISYRSAKIIFGNAIYSIYDCIFK